MACDDKSIIKSESPLSENEEEAMPETISRNADAGPGGQRDSEGLP